MKIWTNGIYAFCCFLAFMQCRPADGDRTGSEYMPDMSHSIAYEPNVNSYYSFNSWGTKADRAKYSTPRHAVKGSIARGSLESSQADSLNKMFSGELSHNARAIPVNGAVNYYYGNTEEERLRASNEILNNPVPITAEGLAKGKLLYDIYCGICHGEKGDGAGYLVRDDGGMYPAQPANLLKEEFIAATEGRMYHAVMYGKNVMGSYADKLSFRERWDVIHYIRSLQAVSLKLVYNDKENTFSSSAAMSNAKKASASAAQAVSN